MLSEEKKAEKLAKFKKLANKRVEALLKRIHVLKHVANPYNYYFEDRHIDMVLGPIRKEMAELEADFKTNAAKIKEMHGDKE